MSEDVEFTFVDDPEEQPQASAFWPLIEGDEEVDAQRHAGRRPMTVGVAGIDKPRIGQVGSAENLPARNKVGRPYRGAAAPANPGVRTHQPPAAGTLCLATRLARAKAEAAA